MFPPSEKVVGIRLPCPAHGHDPKTLHVLEKIDTCQGPTSYLRFADVAAQRSTDCRVRAQLRRKREYP